MGRSKKKSTQYDKGSEVRYTMTPSTKFLLTFCSQLKCNTTLAQIDNHTDTGGAAPEPGVLYGGSNSVNPVNTPQTVGGFIIRSVVYKSQSANVGFIIYAIMLVKIENSQQVNTPTLATVGNAVTLYKPEENIIFADTGIVTGYVSAGLAHLVIDNSNEAFTIKTKRSLNINDGISALWAMADSNNVDTNAVFVNWEGTVSFWMKNNTSS